jgi:signal transduction histidine kinase
MDDRQTEQLLEVGKRLFEALDLETVLARVVEAARDVTGARYAALGILAAEGDRLERFLTSGLDSETRARIGDLPRGRGVLGELIRNPRPLRLSDVGAHPRSYGFPPDHPPMKTFLGVPIAVGGEAYGNLYLTEKNGGDFTKGDEAAACTLAEWAAAAIRNARLHGRVAARRDELEHAVESLQAMTEIARTLAGETELARVLELIAKRGRALVDARSMAIMLVDGDDATVVVCAGELAGELTGVRVPLAGSVVGQVAKHARTERLSGLNRRRFEQHGFGAIGVRATTGLFVPLIFRREVIGVVAALDRFDEGLDFGPHEEDLLTAFAASAANAVWSAQSASAEQRRRSVQATEAERRRWARELHDDTLQELAGVRLGLAAVRDSGDPGELRSVVATAISELDRDIAAVRDLIADVRPAALDELGLTPPLEDLAARMTRRGIPVRLELDLAYETGRSPTRHVPELEDGLYRLAQEALTNVLKHAQATAADVSVAETGDAVTLTVRDDGIGFDPSHGGAGYGITGMRERAELLGGRLHIESTPGQGTALTVTLPTRHRPVAESPARAEAS